MLAVAVVVARRPDAVVHAQFWAEDGVGWFENAYNHGALAQVIRPQDGYFHLAQRVTAALGVLVGLRWAPLVSNGLAILAQVAPAAVMVSSRYARLVPDWRARVAVALLYLLMPNTFEVDANITNVQWHLDLLAAVVVLSTPSSRAGWRALDVGAVVLAGLTGPFAFLVAGIAAIRFWFTRERWTLVLAGLAGVCMVTQALSLLSGVGTHRSRAPLGAGPQRLLAIIGGPLMSGSAIGLSGYAWLVGLVKGRTPLAMIGLGGLVMVGYSVWRGPLELKLFIGFGFATLAAALYSPQVDSVQPQWIQLLNPGAGNRYFLLPGIAFLVALAWLATQAPAPAWRWPAAAVLALVVLVGVPLDFRYPTYHDFQPEHWAAVLDRAPRGSEVIVPVNPPGWHMTLVKQ